MRCQFRYFDLYRMLLHHFVGQRCQPWWQYSLPLRSINGKWSCEMVNWNFCNCITLTFTATRYTHEFDRICVFIQMNAWICTNVGMMISWTMMQTHMDTHTMCICYVDCGSTSKKTTKEQQQHHHQQKNKKLSKWCRSLSFWCMHFDLKLLLLIKVQNTFRSF